MDKRRLWTTTALAVFFLSVVAIYFRGLRAVWKDYDLNHRVMRLLRPEAIANHKTVLLWTSMFGDDWFRFGDTDHFDHCPKYNNCLMTRSRNFLDVTQFDAILFHGNEVDHEDVPWGRDPEQEFVFVNVESPKNRPIPNSYFEDYFNLTMTYRLDSDIVWPPFIVRDINTGKIVAPLKGAKWIEPSYDPLGWKLDLNFDQKKKMAAWLVSNCETYGRREFFVDGMEKVLDVDRIRNCGKTDAPQCLESTDDCFTRVIEPDYFFYLSFEDSLCEDYVTEEFFNALSHNVIPVVYGGANYSRFAPPQSYIDALDFDSPEALARFMINLSHDREEYLKYFWWKRFYTVNPSRDWTLCSICELLNVPKEPKTYSKLSDWYSNNKCPMQDQMNGKVHATKELRYRVNKKS